MLIVKLAGAKVLDVPPTLIIYGINDMAVGEKSVIGSEKYLKGKYKIEKINSGHWLIQESFDLVSKNILEHIR